MARSSEKGVVIPLNRAQLAHDRSSETGYDLVLMGQTSAGELEVSVSLQQTPAQEQVLGLHLTMPRLGKVTLGMSIETDGAMRIASVARNLPDGSASSATLPSEQTLQAKLAALKVELQRERWRSTALEEQLAALQRRASGIEGLKTRLDGIEHENQERVLELQRQVKLTGQQLAQARTELETARAAQAISEETNAALTAEREGLRAELEVAQGELTRVAEEHAELEGLAQEETTAAAERERGLIVERNEAMHERAQLTEKLEAAETSKELLESRVAKLQAQLNERESALATARQSLEGAGDTRRDLATAQARIDSLLRDNAKLELQLSESQTRGTGLEAARVALDSELADAREQLQRALAESEQLKGRVAELVGAGERLRAEMHDAKSLSDTVASQHAEELAQRDAQIAELTRRNETASGQLEEARELITAARKEFEALQVTKQVSTADLEGRLSAEAGRVSELEEQVETLQARLENAVGSAAKLTGERDARARELDALKNELYEERGARARDVAEAQSALASERESRAQELEALQGTVTSQREAHARELEEVRARLEAEKASAAVVAAERDARAQELEAERKLTQEQKERIEEEELRRDELIQDIAFIQSQVADLSHSKGALMSRLEGMAKRETKRAEANSAMSSMLKDAEAVAADRAMSVRKLQLRAEQMEARVAETQAELTRMEKAAEEAVAARELIQSLTAERDALKVQISFFQKQVGAFQRQQQKQSRGGTPLPPAIPRGETPLPPAIPRAETPLPASVRPPAGGPEGSQVRAQPTPSGSELSQVRARPTPGGSEISQVSQVRARPSAGGSEISQISQVRARPSSPAMAPPVLKPQSLRPRTATPVITPQPTEAPSSPRPPAQLIAERLSREVVEPTAPFDITDSSLLPPEAMMTDPGEEPLIPPEWLEEPTASMRVPDEPAEPRARPTGQRRPPR